MMVRAHRFIVEDAGDGWLCATSPDLPGAITQGRTRDELAVMAPDCVGALLDTDAAGVDIDLVIPGGLVFKTGGDAA